MAWGDRPAVRRSRSDVPSGTGQWPDAKRGRMKTRYLLAGLTALGASITMVAQQGAPNEGRTLQGPALRIERNVEYARVGAQALTLDLYEQSRAAKPSPLVLDSRCGIGSRFEQASNSRRSACDSG